EVAADRIHLSGNGLRRTVLSAFEYHVLDEVRQPIELGVFVARPSLDPDPNRNRPDVLHLFRDDGQPVGKHLPVNVPQFSDHKSIVRQSSLSPGPALLPILTQRASSMPKGKISQKNQCLAANHS